MTLPHLRAGLALLLLLMGPLPALAQADLPAVAPATDCAGLVGTDLTDLGGAGSAVTEAQATVSAAGVAACTVRGTLAPAITFAVVMPTEGWTQRYLQLGCGGLCGRLDLGNVGAASGCAVLQAGGFAVASTDMGHDGSDPAWGTDPQRRADFAHRAQHLTALAAKRLVAAFYGQAPAYSYFNGCSDGGREALIAAQRYPGDFDGILAGAPAANFQIQNGLYHAWQAVANLDGAGRPILLAARLPLLHAAVLAACDEGDGLKDGLIANPLACAFDPGTLQCAEGATDASACLTPAEVGAVRRLHDGPSDPASGKPLLIGGPQWGSELRWGVFVPEKAGDEVQSASHALEALTGPSLAEPPPAGFRLTDIVFDAAWVQRLAALHPLYDATNPDLGGFAGAGGKLILYHGWSDTDISPLNTIAYYEAVRARMGVEATEGFARLYLIPGMYHCSQWEGPYEMDLLTPIMAWVEGGTAPDAVVVRQPRDGGGNGFGQFGGPPAGGAPGAARPLPTHPAAGETGADAARAPALALPGAPDLRRHGRPRRRRELDEGHGHRGLRHPGLGGRGVLRALRPDGAPLSPEAAPRSGKPDPAPRA